MPGLIGSAFFVGNTPLPKKMAVVAEFFYTKTGTLVVV